MKRPADYPVTYVATAVIVAYLIWFLAPALVVDIDPNAVAPTGVDSIFNLTGAEIIVSSVLLLLIGYLGWWKVVGLKGLNAGGFKFILPPMVYALLLIAIAAYLVQSDGLPLDGIFDFHTLSLLALVTFLIGFNEEVIFRGFAFGGLIKKFSPLMAVILCAVVFGSFHLLNLLDGQALLTTLSQVLQAASMGFLYAALRLRLGSIWPLIVLHGLWDFSVSLMQQSTELAGIETGVGSSINPMISLPVLVYGIFVYWRWSVTKSA